MPAIPDAIGVHAGNAVEVEFSAAGTLDWFTAGVDAAAVPDPSGTSGSTLSAARSVRSFRVAAGNAVEVEFSAGGSPYLAATVHP